tara:strand:- start:1540 stop:1836 length:297 start_codon:yes stop_codon:yes gene_type:complete
MSALNQTEIETALQGLQGWELVEQGTKLLREIEFNDFRSAMAFLVRLSYECEEMNHHPEIFNVYRTVRLGLNTHDVGGRVTEKDVQLASRINELLPSQ